MGLLGQVTRLFTDAGGRVVPVLHTEFAKSKKIDVTTSASAATSVNSDAYPRPVRLWAVGCAMLYNMGDSNVADPTDTLSGFIAQDASVETYMEETETHIKVKAVTGSGTLRIELLR